MLKFFTDDADDADADTLAMAIPRLFFFFVFITEKHPKVQVSIISS